MLEKFVRIDHDPDTLVKKLMNGDAKEQEKIMEKVQTTTDYYDT